MRQGGGTRKRDRRVEKQNDVNEVAVLIKSASKIKT